MVQVPARSFRVGEDACALDHDLHAVVAPGNLRGVTLGDDRDPLAVDNEVAVDHIDVARVAAVVGVVLEQVRVGLRVCQVVDRHDLEVIAMEVEHALEHLPTDSAEAVDANVRRHEGLLSV